MKKNKCHKTVDGLELWDGRYCCVVGFIFTIIGGHYYILANKRGPGCPSEVGKWNCPCGFLDKGSGEVNIARETYEECGINISPDKFIEWNHNDLSTNRNVTFRYIASIPYKEVDPRWKSKGELNEVSEVKWIPVTELNNYEWEFDHKTIIEQICANNLIHCSYDNN